MRLPILAAIAASIAFAAVAGYGTIRPAAAAQTAQASKFDDAAKRFRDAMEAREFKKLPKLSEELAKTKNQAAIPLMIGAIASEGTLDTIYNIGFFGLATATGVQYDETHDGGWWMSWWEANKGKYPAAKDVALAEFKGFVLRPNVAVPNAPDVASLPSRPFYAGGDRNKLYIVSGPSGSAPVGGYKVLLVLAGGDGGIDFHTFIKRVHLNALGDGYLVAHLVAPKYAGSKDVVWPTKATQRTAPSPVVVEDFIETVIGELRTNYKVDAKKVFALGWSSSGPALYSYISNKPRSLTGAYIAMSVYHPQEMGPLENVRGFPIYILHSPDDKTCPIGLALKARSTLTEAGAKVGWDTYAGGHGWVEDPYGHIRSGMAFLEGS